MSNKSPRKKHSSKSGQQRKPKPEATGQTAVSENPPAKMLLPEFLAAKDQKRPPLPEAGLMEFWEFISALKNVVGTQQLEDFEKFLAEVENIERLEGVKLRKGADASFFLLNYMAFLGMSMEANEMPVDDGRLIRVMSPHGGPLRISDIIRPIRHMRKRINGLTANRFLHFRDWLQTPDIKDQRWARDIIIESVEEQHKELEQANKEHYYERGINLELPQGKTFIASRKLDLENIKEKPTKDLSLLETVLQSIVTVLHEEKKQNERGLFAPEINKRISHSFDVRQTKRYVSVLRKLSLIGYNRALGFYLIGCAPKNRHFRSEENKANLSES